MRAIITNDIEQECSNMISMYTDIDYVNNRIIHNYSNLSKSKQTSVSKKIKSHIDQANSFLRETDDNFLTAPLTLFYAIHNYAKAIFLVNYPNLSLANSHGLDFDNEVAEIANELGEIKCKITSKGAFMNLIYVTKDVLKKGDELQLKDVFSLIPELREIYYYRYFDEPNLVLLKEKSKCISEYKIMTQSDELEKLSNKDWSLPLLHSFHVNISDGKGYVWVDANYTNDKFDKIMYLDVYGNKYLTNGIDVNGKKIKLSKMASLYLVYYAFSMLVRYYPDKWATFCQSADIAFIRKMLVNCRRELMVEVLSLLSGEQYMFSMKLDEDEPDIDARNLLDELLKEARKKYKQTGRNPFDI